MTDSRGCEHEGTKVETASNRLNGVADPEGATPFKSPFYVEPENKKIISKSPNKLGERTIRKNRDKLISNADDSFGKKHSVFYLESAVKKAKKRQDSEPKSEEKIEINVENNHIDLIAEDTIDDDKRIKNALKDLPSKNVLFSDEDQSNILLLFKVVRTVAIERDYECPDFVAAEITEMVLKNKNYYSTIPARTIGRWFVLSEKENKKSGRKINTKFDAEVWGNLMMCVFEKKENEEVSHQLLIISYIYEKLVSQLQHELIIKINGKKN